MFSVGIFQLIAGILLVLSGVLLDSTLWTFVDIGYGLFLIWTSIDRHDPPSQLLEV